MIGLLACALAASALLAGCGSDDTRTGRDEQAARAVLVAYVDAFTGGREDVACQQLTPRARAAMGTQFSAKTTCVQALRFAAALLKRGGAGAKLRGGARTADIEIAGDSAEVRRPPVLTPKNILRYVDGRWYIDRR
jgi:hypothetical protein